MPDSSYTFKKLSAKLKLCTLSGKHYAIRVRVFREQNKISLKITGKGNIQPAFIPTLSFCLRVSDKLEVPA